jgi:hypothetical protein
MSASSLKRDATALPGTSASGATLAPTTGNPAATLRRPSLAGGKENSLQHKNSDGSVAILAPEVGTGEGAAGTPRGDEPDLVEVQAAAAAAKASREAAHDGLDGTERRRSGSGAQCESHSDWQARGRAVVLLTLSCASGRGRSDLYLRILLGLFRERDSFPAPSKKVFASSPSRQRDIPGLDH